MYSILNHLFLPGPLLFLCSGLLCFYMQYCVTYTYKIYEMRCRMMSPYERRTDRGKTEILVNVICSTQFTSGLHYRELNNVS